jgi:hypothetical protein
MVAAVAVTAAVTPAIPRTAQRQRPVACFEVSVNIRAVVRVFFSAPVREAFGAVGVRADGVPEAHRSPSLAGASLGAFGTAKRVL